ncbi:MAG TPA: family 10 glycosylhydrolase [Nodosilinea sp.]|nr:family 10 glycosylhydrolase [Nodosilinea sp.]
MAGLLGSSWLVPLPSLGQGPEPAAPLLSPEQGAEALTGEPAPALPLDDTPPTARPGRRPAETPTIPPLPPSQRPRILQSAPGDSGTDPEPGAASPTTGDPAEQIAPAVIELSPTGRPPSPVVFLAMQQELKNLIGRFESALIMDRALDTAPVLALPDRQPVLTAAAQAVNVSGSGGTHLHPALGEAQQLLNEWDGLLSAGRHSEVRDRWLSARAALWDNFPAERPVNQGEIRAVWLDRGTIVKARSHQGLSQLFDQLAAAGINTVFFETVNAGYTIYPSQVAPEQNPLTRSWDPLAAAVELAHQRGMTLHAWVWVFAAGNQRHNRLLNLPADYPGPVLDRHPSWAAYDNSGNRIPRGQDKPFLDPANPEVRSYLTRLMTEIVTTYDVDGLHLDYIRYPFQDPGANRTYGYGEVARWRFQSITGVDPTTINPRPDGGRDRNQQIQQQVLWERWTEFRVQQVSSFVETISSTLRRQRPDLVLSAAVFANPDHDRLQRIQQDWGSWARADYLDWIVLMSYAADTSRFERLVQPWLVDQSFGSTLVIPAIRLLNLSNAATLDQMQASRDLPTPGYALFAAADLTTELSALLTQSQGRPPSPTTPYAMALSRYEALQREWHWLLSQERLWMDRDSLIAWVEAVNSLGTEFETLAQAPSQRHLAAVQAGLTQVRAPLNQGVLIDTTNSGYRLRSWQHRLTAIEQLLTYGERTQP